MNGEITGTAAGAWLVAVLLLLGCAADAPRTVGHVVRDSAGIEIVESAAPAWNDGEAWRLSEAAFLDIGAREGEQPYLLDGVMGVVRLDDGGIVIANMGDNTLRFYDAQGRHIRSVGRSGEGPGEFQQVMNLHRAGDLLYATQFLTASPTQVFDASGKFVSSIIPRVSLPTIAIGTSGVLGDGAPIAVSWPQGEPPRSDPSWTEPIVVYRMAPDGGTVDSLFSRPGQVFAPMMRHGSPVVFGPRARIEVNDGGIYYGFGEKYEIEVHDAHGVLRRIIRRSWTPEPVTEPRIARYKEELLDLGAEGGGEPSPRLREQRQRMAEEATFAPHHAAFEELLADEPGNLWVEATDPDRTQHTGSLNPTYDSPSRWDVFDARGVWLGEVEMPPRFRPYEIGPDYVAGFWRDDVDVEHARVYALHKS